MHVQIHGGLHPRRPLYQQDGANGCSTTAAWHEACDSSALCHGGARQSLGEYCGEKLCAVEVQAAGAHTGGSWSAGDVTGTWRSRAARGAAASLLLLLTCIIAIQALSCGLFFCVAPPAHDPAAGVAQRFWPAAAHWQAGHGQRLELEQHWSGEYPYHQQHQNQPEVVQKSSISPVRSAPREQRSANGSSTGDLTPENEADGTAAIRVLGQDDPDTPVAASATPGRARRHPHRGGSSFPRLLHQTHRSLASLPPAVTHLMHSWSTCTASSSSSSRPARAPPPAALRTDPAAGNWAGSSGGASRGGGGAWDFRFYDNEDCLRFVRREFPQYLTAYLALGKDIERADFFRYMVVLRHGGVYADVDVECRAPLEPLLAAAEAGNYTLLVGWEAEVASKEQAFKRHFVRRRQVLQWFFAAVPGHPVLRAACDSISAHATRRLSNNTNRDTLEKTGPGLFTDLVLKHFRDYYRTNADGDAGAAGAAGSRGAEGWKVMVLPRVAFGVHTSGNDAMPPDAPGILALHHYLGSWKRQGGWQRQRGLRSLLRTPAAWLRRSIKAAFSGLLDAAASVNGGGSEQDGGAAFSGGGATQPSGEDGDVEDAIRESWSADDLFPVTLAVHAVSPLEVNREAAAAFSYHAGAWSSPAEEMVSSSHQGAVAIFEMMTSLAGHGDRSWGGEDVSAAVTAWGNWHAGLAPSRRPSVAQVLLHVLQRAAAFQQERAAVDTSSSSQQIHPTRLQPCTGTFVDAGAGYGLFSLAAAAAGHKVVAINSGPGSRRATSALRACIRHNRLGGLVTLLHADMPTALLSDGRVVASGASPASGEPDQDVEAAAHHALLMAPLLLAFNSCGSPAECYDRVLVVRISAQQHLTERVLGDLVGFFAEHAAAHQQQQPAALLVEHPLLATPSRSGDDSLLRAIDQLQRQLNYTRMLHAGSMCDAQRRRLLMAAAGAAAEAEPQEEGVAADQPWCELLCSSSGQAGKQDHDRRPAGSGDSDDDGSACLFSTELGAWQARRQFLRQQPQNLLLLHKDFQL